MYVAKVMTRTRIGEIPLFPRWAPPVPLLRRTGPTEKGRERPRLLGLRLLCLFVLWIDPFHFHCKYSTYSAYQCT